MNGIIVLFKKFYIIFLICIFILAIGASLFAPHNPYSTNVSRRLEPPSLEYLFGTDALGRCVLSRVIYGARLSLKMGISILFLSLMIGGFLGVVAGYFGGKIDEIIMRFTDIFMAMPSIVIALVLVNALGPGIFNMVIVISISMWTGYTRMIRGLILDIKNEHYVEVARMTGFNAFYILRKHILPGVLPPILVMASLGMGRNIIMTSSLSFLGLGIVEPLPDWGAMLNKGTVFIRTAPHIAFFPGLLITLTVLCFNMLGDKLSQDIQIRKTSG